MKKKKSGTTKVAVVSLKGGVGKSSSTIFLADGLKHMGYSVLVIDLDPQCNTTYTYRAKYEDTATVCDLLRDDCTAEDAIQHMDLGDIIASDKILVTEEPMLQTKPGREFHIKKHLDQLEGKYDFILMDTPPNQGVLTLNAITAANGCMIPVKCDDYSVIGLKDIQRVIEEAKSYVNPDLSVYGVFATVYDKSRAFHRQFIESLPDACKSAGFHVFKTSIRKCADIDKARIMGASLIGSAEKSNGAIDYMALTKEMLKEVK